jgi:hypothetical protein
MQHIRGHVGWQEKLCRRPRQLDLLKMHQVSHGESCGEQYMLFDEAVEQARDQPTASPSIKEYFLPMTTMSQYQNGVETNVVHNSVSWEKE